MADRQLSAALSSGPDFMPVAADKASPLAFRSPASLRGGIISRGRISRSPYLQKSSKTDSRNGIGFLRPAPPERNLPGLPSHSETMRTPQRRIILVSCDHESAMNHAPALPFCWLHWLWMPSSVLSHPRRLLGPSTRAFGFTPRCLFCSPALGRFPVPP